MNWKLGFEEKKRRLRTTPRSPVFDDVASDLHKPRRPTLLVPNHARLHSCPVVNIPPLFLSCPIHNPNVGHDTLLSASASSPTAVVIEGRQLLARLPHRWWAENATHRSPNSAAHRRLSQRISGVFRLPEKKKTKTASCDCKKVLYVDTKTTSCYLIFSVNKQTKHFFSYFNYYQLRMVFFSIIKKQKKYLIIDQCWLFNSHKKYIYILHAIVIII